MDAVHRNISYVPAVSSVCEKIAPLTQCAGVKRPINSRNQGGLGYSQRFIQGGSFGPDRVQDRRASFSLGVVVLRLHKVEFLIWLRQRHLGVDEDAPIHPMGEVAGTSPAAQ